MTPGWAGINLHSRTEPGVRCIGVLILGAPTEGRQCSLLRASSSSLHPLGRVSRRAPSCAPVSFGVAAATPSLEAHAERLKSGLFGGGRPVVRGQLAGDLLRDPILRDLWRGPSSWGCGRRSGPGSAHQPCVWVIRRRHSALTIECCKVLRRPSWAGTRPSSAPILEVRIPMPAAERQGPPKFHVEGAILRHSSFGVARPKAGAGRAHSKVFRCSPFGAVRPSRP